MDEPDPSTQPATAGRGPSSTPAGIVGLVLLSALFAVWAWQYGGWFGTALYPGTAVLAAGVVLLALFAPMRARVAGWPMLALGGLLALGLWATLSAAWSPSPDVAVEDGQRIFTYAMAFVLGFWFAGLLRDRLHLALVPVVFAAGFAGAQTVIGALTADELGRFLIEGILQRPLGYHNANAAFFLVALWPAVALAASRELAWPVRALSLAVATLSLELALLSQSRGSIIGAAVALIVYLLTSRDRARAIGWLLLAVIPALITIPELTDLYETAANFGPQPTFEALQSAARAAALGAVVAAVAGGAAALVGRRLGASEARARLANTAASLAIVAGLVAGAATFVVATGDPVGWFGDRWEELRTQGTPDTEGASTRLSFNAGSERDDQWRVALDDAREDPVLGNGAGAFYYSYLRGRSEDGVPSARDAHSVELEFLGELGAPGLAMFCVVVAGCVGGAIRARRAGEAAAALSAAALTAGAYWLTHASIDWFWSFPALTAPVLALMGSAAAPAVLGPGPGRTRMRWVTVALAAILAVSVIPPYLSDSYTDQAFAGWKADPERAFEQLDRAATMNPLAEEPYLAEGGIARESGDRARAIAAFEEASDKRPEEWAAHYFLAKLYLEEDLSRARRELAIAAEQNPLSDRVAQVERALDRASGD